MTGRYRDTEPLKKGELVVMHTCVEARNPKYEGKIWTCRTDQFTRGEGVYAQDSVFLEGFSGSFAAEYLQRVNIIPLLAEKDAIIESLERQIKCVNETLAEGTPQPGMSGENYIDWMYSVLPFLDEGDFDA
jgi:hypothetical protein